MVSEVSQLNYLIMDVCISKVTVPITVDPTEKMKEQSWKQMKNITRDT